MINNTYNINSTITYACPRLNNKTSISTTQEVLVNFSSVEQSGTIIDYLICDSYKFDEAEKKFYCDLDNKSCILSNNPWKKVY